MRTRGGDPGKGSSGAYGLKLDPTGGLLAPRRSGGPQRLVGGRLRDAEPSNPDLSFNYFPLESAEGK